MFGELSHRWLEEAWKQLKFKGRRSDLTEEQKDALFFTAMFLKLEAEHEEQQKIQKAKLTQLKQELAEDGLAV